MSGAFPGTPGRFTPAELDGTPGVLPDDVAADQRTARELEDLAVRTAARPTAGFADRVMGAIVAEPAPAPARVARLALRRGALGAFLVALHDAWRVTVGRGFPVAVRAQAFALVLVVVALGAGTGVATAGALGMLGPEQGHPLVVDGPSPAPVVPAVTASPSLETQDATPTPSETAEPADDSSRSHPPETESPTGTDGPDATDDHHGGSGTGSGSGSGDHGGSPTGTPGEDHGGSRTPEPSDDGEDQGGGGSHHGGSGTPGPSETPDD